MSESFAVYIDESGDEGFAFRSDGSGSSRWLVLSAVVFRKSNDSEAVRLLQDVREKLGKAPKQPLHFRNLKHEQRVPYVRAIGSAKLRTVSVLIHKESIREPELFQADSYRLYRYASRLLLERVSWLCRDHCNPGDGDGTAKITFSNRSRMSYDDLRGYLLRLKESSEAQDVRIDWNVVKPERVNAINHDQRAGLQIADAVASGLYSAANLNIYGESEDRYLRLLEPTIYRRKQMTLGYGLKFWPEDLDTMAMAMPHLSAFSRK